MCAHVHSLKSVDVTAGSQVMRKNLGELLGFWLEALPLNQTRGCLIRGIKNTFANFMSRYLQQKGFPSAFDALADAGVRTLIHKSMLSDFQRSHACRSQEIWWWELVRDLYVGSSNDLWGDLNSIHPFFERLGVLTLGPLQRTWAMAPMIVSLEASIMHFRDVNFPWEMQLTFPLINESGDSRRQVVQQNPGRSWQSLPQTQAHAGV